MELFLKGCLRKGCLSFLNVIYIIRFLGVEEVKEDGVLCECKFFLNIIDVWKKKLKFMVFFYFLELNFDEFIKVWFEGRKIINEFINLYDFSYIYIGENVCDDFFIYFFLVIKFSVGNFRNW